MEAHDNGRSARHSISASNAGLFAQRDALTGRVAVGQSYRNSFG